MDIVTSFLFICSKEFSKQCLINILELEEKVGDAAAYEAFVRTTITTYKIKFYNSYSARIIDEIEPECVQLKIQLDFYTKFDKKSLINYIQMFCFSQKF